MGKRSPGQFERKPRDLYPTPYAAVPPLLPHLQPRTRFIEPCAGDGRLIGYLQEHGHICEAAFDIAPQDRCIITADASRLRETTIAYGDLYYITNPPWKRELLHELIVVLSSDHPTWLLFDADWVHTKQARPFLKRCRRIVSVGRLKWEEDSKHQGKDNAAWYLFTATISDAAPLFHPRGDD
jgi:hypothetical protein